MNAGLTVVTGAAGFIGSALCTSLRDQGRLLRGIVREAYGAPAQDLQALGDLAEASESTLDALVAGADTLVHLAGRAHVMRETTQDADASYRRANADATRRLARAAARSGVRRFVLASTVKVNGEATLAGQPFRPGDPPCPQDAYARSKLEAEQALAAAVAGSQTVPIVLRLPLVYGRDAKGNFARLVEAIVAGRRLPLASIRNRRSLVYLGNLVAAVEAVIDAPVLPAGVHFVADAHSPSTPELVRAIARAWKVQPRLVAVPVPLLRLAGAMTGRGTMLARLTGSLEVDTTSLQTAVGWQPRWTLDAALETMAAGQPVTPQLSMGRVA